MGEEDTSSTPSRIDWTYQYNDLNQLEKQYSGTDWSTGTSGDERTEYTYDANGNLSTATTDQHNGSSWNETLEWVYTWNVRDQLTLAMKYENASANNAGSVAYEPPVAVSLEMN